MDLYVPQEERAEPKPLIDRLDEAEGCIKGLLLDTANLAAAIALSTIKYHDPSFDLLKVSEGVDLSGLVRREDIVAAAEEVVKKFDFGVVLKRTLDVDWGATVVNKLVIEKAFAYDKIHALFDSQALSLYMSKVTRS
jgi:hypothetical protein